MFRTTTVKSSDHRRQKLVSMTLLRERTNITLPSTKVLLPHRRSPSKPIGPHYVTVRSAPEASLDPARSSLHSEIFGWVYPDQRPV
jgi:hypothetical protein